MSPPPLPCFGNLPKWQIFSIKKIFQSNNFFNRHFFNCPSRGSQTLKILKQTLHYLIATPNYAFKKHSFFFIKPNFQRKYQTFSSGQKFFGKKCIFFAEKLLPWRRRLILSSKIWFNNKKNFSLLPFINWLINMIPRILIFATIKAWFTMLIIRRNG